MSSAYCSFEELPRFLSDAVHGFLDRECIVAITDVTGSIVFANNEFCKISGYPAEELLGQNHRLLKSGQHPAQFYRNMWATVARGETWRGEICNRAKDGHFYWVDSTLSPVRGIDGRISHYMALRVDITARKNAEAALDAMRLRQAEEHRLESLGRMADGVLHDLNNLLFSALALSELMSETSGPRMDLLKSSLNRMAHLTRNLRDFATGRPTDQRDFALAGLVEEVCELALFSKLRSGAIDLQVDLGPLTGCWVTANEGQVLEVFLNLLTNAAEALHRTPQPRIVVAGWFDPGQERAVITVKDNGPGVPKSVVNELFEPYRSSKGQGRGLGLSVARKIVRAHHGELSLENSPTGACFRVELPAEQRLGTAEPRVMPSDTPRVVLVADDDPTVCTALSQVLAAAGFRPIATQQPDELLVRAEQYRDVLAAAVLDSMGVAEGFSLLHYLRGIRAELPVVLTSATLNRARIDVSQLGPVSLLPKPFSGERLISVVRQMGAERRP